MRTGKNPRSQTSPKKRPGGRGERKYWSANVTRSSNALDLEPGVFKKLSAEEIARSLKRAAERSSRREGTPFQSAMAMLSFYINRAGRNLSDARLQTLRRAKQELRKAFGKKR
jgi:hypothetical protein